MRTRYLTGFVRAEQQTEKAFKCSFDWDDDHGYSAVGLWVPLSAILDEDHSEIDDASTGDMLEISIAEWWLIQKL